MVPEISSDESATSPIFLRSENLVEKKKTFTHATEVVVDSSSFGINRVLCPKSQGKFEVSLGILDRYMCRNFSVLPTQIVQWSFQVLSLRLIRRIR